MRNVIYALPVLGLALAGCNPTTGQPDPVLTGAGTGAVLGAVVADNEVEGALVGAAIGAGVGGLAGAAQEGPRCRYRYPDGRVEIAPCP